MPFMESLLPKIYRIYSWKQRQKACENAANLVRVSCLAINLMSGPFPQVRQSTHNVLATRLTHQQNLQK